MFPFSLLFLGAWGVFFSDIYCGNLAKLLEINLPILRGLPMTESPWIFNYQSRTHWASSNSSVTYRSSVLTSVVVPTATSTCELTLCPVSLGSLYLPVCVYSLGGHRSPSYGSKRSCWFFSLFRFFTCKDRVTCKPKLPNICDFNFNFNMGKSWAHMT